MFKTKYKVIKELPKLSWLADVAINTVSVYCGENVEIHENFCVAGVWDGDFSSGNFVDARFFCGSGMKINENLIRFSTASHALEKLFLYRCEGHVIVSNSAPFLLAYCHLSLVKEDSQYERHFCSILDGINRYEKYIPVSGKENIEQYFVADITVDCSLSVVAQRKMALQGFNSFEDFYGQMQRDIEKIYLNATSKDRNSSGYGVISTISSGYDSCACATVAKKLGCTTVVSLSGGKYDADSGLKAAMELGYQNLIQREQQSYKVKKGCIDAEYVCSGELGTHLQFSVFEDLFSDNLVFMGLRGDYYWGLSSEPNNDFEMRGFYYYETNIGYIENALKNNYIIIPLPTYGTSVSTSIRLISLSKEMAPWRLYNDYDRPIPRRIVESAGVSRESFGQKKSGGGFSFGYDTIKTVQRKMTIEGYNSFVSYTRIRNCRRILQIVNYSRMLLPTYINIINKKMRIPKRFKQPVIRMGNPGAPADLIHWGMEKMIDKYQVALRGCENERSKT